MKIVKFVICLILLISCWYSRYFLLKFPDDCSAVLSVNGDEVYPKFSKNIKNYYPRSLSAISSNFMTFGRVTKKFEIAEITPQTPPIDFKIGDETYYLHVWQHNLTEFKATGAENVRDGYYFLTHKWWDIQHTFPAYILNKYGKILYYRYARDDTGKIKSTSDFKFTYTHQGKKLYSLVEHRTLLIMNDLFQPIKRVHLILTPRNNSRLLDGHHYILLDENHYIFFAAHIREIIDNKNDDIMFITTPYIQEIKEGKIQLEWDGYDFLSMIPLPYENYPILKGGIYDLMHLNTIVIDPKDQNLILSYKSTNTLFKINRKNGSLIWQLSGDNDNFHLTENQKFYGQHFPVFTSTGSLVVFDNHHDTKKTPGFIKENTSVKEFLLDEKNKKILKYKKIMLPFKSFSMGNAYPLKDGGYALAVGKTDISDDLCAQEWSADGHLLWTLESKIRGLNLFCYYLYKEEL